MKLAVSAVVGIVMLVGGAMSGLLLVPAVGMAPPSAPTPSGTAIADIPAELFDVYRAAAEHCGMPWAVLAAVGKVETDHGRYDAPGVHAGSNSAGAAGPMQFLAGTWAAYGTDADGDGFANVYSPVDAIWGAARYLCANGAADPAQLESALWHYNHDPAYVTRVLDVAETYTTAAQATAIKSYALPLPVELLTPASVLAPHHDYPAIDLPAPVGTVAFAVTDGVVLAADLGTGRCGGTVVLLGDDGLRYTYCHASRVLVAIGQRIEVGEVVLLTGGRPGDIGAGRSSGPHLHFAIDVDGRARCPQPVLRDWLAGLPTDPRVAPATGCTITTSSS